MELQIKQEFKGIPIKIGGHKLYNGQWTHEDSLSRLFFLEKTKALFPLHTLCTYFANILILCIHMAVVCTYV